jgi:hypothetical protein
LIIHAKIAFSNAFLIFTNQGETRISALAQLPCVPFRNPPPLLVPKYGQRSIVIVEESGIFVPGSLAKNMHCYGRKKQRCGWLQS